MARKSKVVANTKNDAFSGFKRDKKKLKSPFTAVFEASSIPLEKSNWHDIQMPEFLWLALIVHAFDEKEAIRRLRGIAEQWPDVSQLNNRAVQPGSLTAIAGLNHKARRHLLTTILREVGAKTVLAPLCHLPGLPARDDWVSVFGEEETIEHWHALGDAIQACSMFDSDRTTDICWFIDAVSMLSGQITAANGVREDFDAIRAAYPGNRKRVGGLFRCSVGNMRLIPADWPATFWKEVYRKFPPASAPPEHQYLTDNDLGAAYHLTSLVGILANHYWQTRKGSDDRIHETAFGIALAAATLAYEVVELRVQNRFCGLATLRTVAESTINLSFLARRNNPDLWTRFRQYGSGQAHLISCKLDSSRASAHCIDTLWINAFLQEEQSKHFIDIDLGDWAGNNIRARAEEGGTKDIYDSYYDYSSSLLHGDWLGAATFGTTWDVNPFHRLQRIPRQYPRNLPSVVPDLFRVLNRLLDSLVLVFPGLDFRLPETSVAGGIEGR